MFGPRPERELHRLDDRHRNTDEHRIATANCDRCRHHRRDQGCPQLMVAGAGAEPDLELGHDREDDGKHPINGHRVGPEAAQAREERVHPLKVNGRRPHVIGRVG